MPAVAHSHFFALLQMPQILVIEDHKSLLRSITKSLCEAGWDVLGADSLAVARQVITPSTDLIVLDLMLPDGSGLDWLVNVRRSGNRSLVLILTARDSIDDRVIGLDAGADDYLIKPFALDELLARVRALLRRETHGANTKIAFRDITVDLVSRQAFRGDQLIDMQNRQFELLVYLIKHLNQVVTREMIARDVWKEPTATWTNVIEVQINQLRKKLDSESEPALLHTVRNQGYLLGELP